MEIFWIKQQLNSCQNLATTKLEQILMHDANLKLYLRPKLFYISIVNRDLFCKIFSSSLLE